MKTSKNLFYLSMYFFGVALCNTSMAYENTDHESSLSSGEDGSRSRYQSSVLNELNDGMENPFLRSVDLSADVLNKQNKKLNGYLRTLIPISYDSDQNRTFFFAPGVSYFNNRLIYNIGLGFRHLVEGEAFFWGVNAFYDNESRVGNQRFSHGFELGVPFVTFSGNFYRGAGGWNEKKLNTAWEEKAASGYDARLQVELPFYPQVALSTRYFAWKGKNIDLYGQDKYQESPRGFVHGIEYRPVPLLGLSFQKTLNRGNYKNNNAINLNLRYDFGRSLDSQTSFNWKDEPSSLEHKLFNPVERENAIIVKSREIKQRPLMVIVPEVSVLPPEGISDDGTESEVSDEKSSISDSELGDDADRYSDRGAIGLSDTESEFFGKESDEINRGVDTGSNPPSDGLARYHTTSAGYEGGHPRFYSQESQLASEYGTLVDIQAEGVPEKINPDINCAYARYYSKENDPSVSDYCLTCPIEAHKNSHVVTVGQTMELLKGYNRKALNEDGRVIHPEKIKNPFTRTKGMYKQDDPEFISLTTSLTDILKASAIDK